MADGELGEVLVDVEGVSKRFCRDLRSSLVHGVRDIAGELLGTGVPDRRQLRRGEFWALDDVSFQLRRGECLGLIGPNGAGKSTLLKLISGLIKPDAGRIRVRGRVGALIELGAGFHPLLTGRENIRVNASILGLDQRQLADRQDAIIGFADIGDAIDAPVQSYSSGMRARLGFAIAAHLDPDVLLIDEVLAVGDVGFRGKCYNRLAEMQDRSAFILVTHNMEAIARVCNHGMLLVGGRLRYFGNSTLAAHAYFEEFEPPSGVQRSNGVQLVSSRLDETLAEHNGYSPRAINIRLRVVCEFSRAILMPELVVCVVSMAGEYVTHNSNVFSGNNFSICGPGVVAFEILLQEMRLASGTYALSFALRDHSRRSFLLWAPRLQTFHVRTSQIASAHYVPAASFRIEQDPHASSMPLVANTAPRCGSGPSRSRST